MQRNNKASNYGKRFSPSEVTVHHHPKIKVILLWSAMLIRLVYFHLLWAVTWYKNVTPLHIVWLEYKNGDTCLNICLTGCSYAQSSHLFVFQTLVNIQVLFAIQYSFFERDFGQSFYVLSQKCSLLAKDYLSAFLLSSVGTAFLKNFVKITFSFLFFLCTI